MVDRICVVLEALSIAVCLHRLYGKKFRFDIATASLMTIEMIMMQAIDYFGWPKELSMLFALAIVIYCIIEFGPSLITLVINIVLAIVIISILQVIVMMILYTFNSQQVLVGRESLILNCVILGVVIFVLPRFSLMHITDLFKEKEKILMVSLVICIAITSYWLINFKRINFLSHIGWFQNILFSICILMIVFLIFRLGKYKLKSKEVETELKMHVLYANSFDNLIESIRIKQHEFDNHINTIYSQHYIFNTYEELVKAQENYCELVITENRFNKLLSSGNRVIIGFLYGKFNEIDKLGIDISYRINIGELEVGVPVYKLVELLGNLIGNAVEAMTNVKDYNKLYVLMVEEKHNLWIEVRNESDYINYKEIECFFAKGYSKKGKNRGFGLYHVKNICDDYKLNLSCQNKEIDKSNWISFMITNKKETI